MPNYKLIYFNLKARAEVPRLMFTEAGVEYEDRRVEFNEWPSLKPKTPLGQLPILVIDDYELPQSGAIVRFLSREFDLCGDTSRQAAEADVVYETVNEIFSSMPFMEKDEAKKAEKTGEVFKNRVIPAFQHFESQLLKKKDQNEDIETCLFVGTRITYADLVLMNASMIVQEIREGFMEDFPSLKALMEKTAARQKIKAYLDHRPPTPF